MNRLLLFIAVVFAAITAFAKNNARADIYFTNGKVLENIEMKLPGSWYEKVEYFIDGKKHKIHADSIDHILLSCRRAREKGLSEQEPHREIRLQKGRID